MGKLALVALGAAPAVIVVVEGTLPVHMVERTIHPLSTTASIEVATESWSHDRF